LFYLNETEIELLKTEGKAGMINTHEFQNEGYQSMLHKLEFTGTGS